MKRTGPTERRVHLVQGDVVVTDDADIVLTTILGSCIAACMRDPTARVGGMNHFLLPDLGPNAACEGYGVHLMELLVNDLMKRGARRERLQAKLFGGANIIGGVNPVGYRNADFAQRFLSNEGIRLVNSSLRGEAGRRIEFWPVSGRVRQSYICATEVPSIMPRQLSASSAGDLELF